MVESGVIALNHVGVADPGGVPPTNGFVRATLDSTHSAQALRVHSPSLTPHSKTPVVFAFHTGRKPSPQRPVYEYTRQLHDQAQALSVLTIDEYLKGRAAFNNHGRQAAPTWVTRERKSFADKITNRLINKHHIDRSTAHTLAGRAVRALAVLHNPDQGLGGRRAPSRGFGGLRVNSSIGPQGRTLAQVLDKAAAAVPGHLRETTGFDLLIILAHRSLAQKINQAGGTVTIEPGQAPGPRTRAPTPQLAADAIARKHATGRQARVADILATTAAAGPARTPTTPRASPQRRTTPHKKQHPSRTL